MSGDLFSSQGEVKVIMDFRERCQIEWDVFRYTCPNGYVEFGADMCSSTGVACPEYEEMLLGAGLAALAAWRKR